MKKILVMASFLTFSFAQVSAGGEPWKKESPVYSLVKKASNFEAARGSDGKFKVVDGKLLVKAKLDENSNLVDLWCKEKDYFDMLLQFSKNSETKISKNVRVASITPNAANPGQAALKAAVLKFYASKDDPAWAAGYEDKRPVESFVQPSH